MAKMNNKRVHLMVNKNFYDNVYRKEKDRIEKMIGTPFKNTNQFTEYLDRCNARFKIPKARPIKKIKKMRIRRMMF